METAGNMMVDIYYMSELNANGGIQPLMKTLIEKGLMNGNCITVTGKTLKDNLEEVQPYKNNEIIKLTN